MPDKIQVAYLKKFRSMILALTKRGYRFVIVTGGGGNCRQYQQAAKQIGPISHQDLDWVGIASTKLNAELVRSIFGRHAYHEVIDNPTKRVATSKRILVGAGWQPGSSSDKDAVLLAKAYRAKTVINMSNINHVYTDDPKKVKSAKPIKQMTWEGLLVLTGTKWKPGAHVPFDPAASKLASQFGLKVIVCLGTDLRNLKAIITGQKYRGTLIS